MGSTAILVGAVALGTTLISLFLGYRWGRSNVRSQIEDALNMARGSADAREFALREQLDDQMMELGKLRAYAERVLLSQQQLEQVQPSGLQNSPSRSAAADAPNTGNAHRPPESQHATTPVAGSAERPIQNFLNSKEEKPRQPDESQDELPEKNRRLPVTKFPVRFPHSFTAQNTTPEPSKSPAVQPVPAKSPAVQPQPAKSSTAQSQPAKSPAVKPLPAASPAVRPLQAVNNDDWDEFAKSLEALKGLQK
jgi:hypothetical protein